MLDELITVLTDQINSAVRSTVDNYLLGRRDGQRLYRLEGLDGHATKHVYGTKSTVNRCSNGDSLRLIHLDANVKLNLPNEMSFPIYMEVREVDSQSGNIACVPAGDDAQEVVLGAKNVPLKWPGAQTASDLTLTAEARWTLQKGTVIGIGGLLEVDGNAAFEGCSFKTIGATFAFGETENYFAAKADASALIGAHTG